MALTTHKLSIFLVFGILLGACVADPGSDNPIAPAGEDLLEVQVLDPIVMRPETNLVEDDGAFQSVDVTDDGLVFHTSGPLARPIVEGDILPGFGGPDGYLRRVLSVVSQTDTRIELATGQADLTDAIERGSFEVVYAPTEGETRDMLQASASQDGVIGRSESPLLNSVGFLSGGSKTFRCGATASVLDAAVVDTTLRMEDFGVDSDLTLTYVWRIIPTGIEEFKLVLRGSIRAGMTIETTDTTSVVCEVNLFNNGVGAALEKDLPTLRFTAGPIPIVYKHKLKPRGVVRISLEYGERSTTSYEVNVGLEAGFHYVDGEWNNIWNPTSSGDGTLVAENERFAGRIGIEGGIEYEGKFYGYFGPTMYLVVFSDAEFTRNADGCGIDMQVDWGVNNVFRGELKVPWRETSLRLEVADIDWVRRPLYNATFDPINECGTDPPMCSPTGCSGSGASFDAECCDALICVVGRCVEPIGVREREACADGCAEGLSCIPVGNPDAAPTCCARADQYCTDNADCCGMMGCFDNRCRARTATETCIPGDCAGALLCNEGFCGG